MAKLTALLFLLFFVAPFANADVSTEGSLLAAKNKNDEINKEDASILERHYPFYFAYGSPV